MKEFLITSVCDDKYIEGARVMLHSVKKHLSNINDIDFVVFYDDSIAKLSPYNMDKLRAIIPDIAFEPSEQSKYAQIRVGFEDHRPALIKLEMFKKLKQYKKVIHIDTDMLCLGDFSELFIKPCPIAMAHCRNKKNGHFNTGLIVLEDFNGEDLYASLMTMVQDTDKYMLDQPIINKLVQENGITVEVLPQAYNYPYLLGHPDIQDEAYLERNLQEIKILHWSGHSEKRKKPWQKPNPDALSWRLWQSAYEELSEKYDKA